jgi:hypothetical protein
MKHRYPAPKANWIHHFCHFSTPSGWHSLHESQVEGQVLLHHAPPTEKPFGPKPPGLSHPGPERGIMRQGIQGPSQGVNVA